MPDATMPPAPAQADTDSDMSELCVPLASLAMPGESEQSVPPGVGDTVEVKVGGTVSRVDGDNAYVTVETVNGQPVPESSEPAETEPDEDDMRAIGAQADDEQTY